MTRTYSHDKYNRNIQYYKGIPLKLIIYTEEHFSTLNAKRFMIIGSKAKQNLWIPNVYLEEDGSIKKKANLDWLFIKPANQHKLELEQLRFPN